MPSDLMVMLTVGVHLDQGHSSFVDALPFIALTTLVAATPLLLRAFSWAVGPRPRCPACATG